jgi:hypothetical protein
MPCQHGLNPVACLRCYHTAVAQKPTSQPVPRNPIPHNAIIDAVKNVHREAQQADGMLRARMKEAGMTKEAIDAAVPLQPMSEPTVVQQPVHVGYLPNGDPVPPPPVEELGRPKVRGKMPVPVFEAGAGGGRAGAVIEPFSYAQKPWETKTVRIAGQKVEVSVPPKHGSLIDSLPRHPHPEPVRR